MPTERFYHLPEEKKKLIREAAIKEFCRVPLEKASINKIVKSADISRGSFYTYFQDKEDVLEYIYEDLFTHLQDFCKKVLRESGGDIWALSPALLEHTLEICQKDRLFAMTQQMNGHNTVLDLLNKKICPRACPPAPWTGGEKGSQMDGGQREEQEKEGIIKAMEGRMYLFFQELYELTDTRCLKVDDLEEFRALFSTCLMVMVGTLGDIYQKGDDIEDAKRMFRRRLDYLKYGAVRL